MVTHNNEDLVTDCVAAIARATVEHSYEVLVVDNGSTDRTVARVGELEGHVRVLPLGRDVGFAAANNRGIAESAGRVVVLVNSDAFPDPGAIDRLIEALERKPEAGIIGGRLRYPSGRLQPSWGRFPSLVGGLWIALSLHRAPGIGRFGVGLAANPALYRTPRRVDWVTAAFCAARRSAGMLPTAAPMYGEDVEWAFSVQQRELEVWLEPAAGAVHIGQASVTKSRDVGFAQRRRANFELRWFARRGRWALLLARGILILHALARLAPLAVMALVHRNDGGRRLAEQASLLRAAFSRLESESRSPA